MHKYQSFWNSSGVRKKNLLIHLKYDGKKRNDGYPQIGVKKE